MIESFPIVQSERLRLEPLAIHHASALLDYEVRNCEHLRPWEPARDDSYYSLEAIRYQIERAAAAAAQQQSVRFAAFENDDDDRIVALLNLWDIRRSVFHCAGFGYSVDREREGRGYATEAARAVIDFAFGTLNLHRIETSYQPHNVASGRVLRKLGFVVEGYSRDRLFINGAWRDGILVALINEEWRPST